MTDLLHYVPGAVQALSTVTVGYPFDTVKSQMQVQNFKNSWECTKHVYGYGGVRSFYRGASIPYFTLVFKRAIQFHVYEHLKTKCNPYVAGLGAAVSMCWISSPMQNIKLNMQVKQKYDSVAHFVRARHAAEGIRGFYRGFRITLFRDVTFGSIYLGTYGNLKKVFGDSYYSPFFAGGCSSIFTWSILLPIDQIKTIVQTNRRESISSVIRKTPITKYWKSIGPTTLRVFPVSGISMVAYEAAKSACNLFRV